ncbi:vWA domain-containing protein, partial [Actinomadura sediminis]
EPPEGAPGPEAWDDPDHDGRPDGPGHGPAGGRGDGGPDGGPGGEGPDDGGPAGGARPDGPAEAPGTNGAAPEPSGDGARDGGAPAESEPAPADAAYKPRLFTVPGVGAGAPGRRSKARSPYGRVSGARPGARGLHLTATLRAAAPHQSVRGRNGTGLIVRPGDLRETVRDGREGNLVLFVVDASGSMAARARMRAVKGAVLSLLLDAYQRRDKVGLITFRGREAALALPPTSSVEAGARRLERLPTGGRTPLSAGLLRAADVLRVERLRDPARRPLLVVVTDGRATHGPDPAAAAARLSGVASVVVDCESGPVRLGLAAALGARLAAEVVRLDDLAADSLAGLVRGARAA